MPDVRRLGDGYAPHVDEIDGELIYSLPVDSGFISAQFAFSIRPDDLDILIADPYRRAVLEVLAHTKLQHSMSSKDARMTQAAFDALVARTLHSAPDELEAYIAEVGRDRHIAIGHYVAERMHSRPADKPGEQR